MRVVASTREDLHEDEVCDGDRTLGSEQLSEAEVELLPVARRYSIHARRVGQYHGSDRRRV